MPVVVDRGGVVVVDKPPRMVVHATRGAVGRPLLQRLRDQLGQRLWPLHRLDAATSGAIAFARSAELAAALSPAFAEGRVDKRYLAWVRGVPEPATGIIDHPVPRRADGPRVPAVTGYRRLWTSGRYSLVALRPATGRRHQLRRHLKHRSWPIIGDVRYGKGEHNRKFRSEVGLDRLALHAAFLGLDRAEGRLEAVVPLPPDLARPLAAFGVPAELLASAHEVELPAPPAPHFEACTADDEGD